MSERSHRSSPDAGTSSGAATPELSPGKVTLTEQLSPVQRISRGTTHDDVHTAAARGTGAPSAALPFGDRIQHAFGRHDVGSIQAHTGAAANEATSAMGAAAYATGNHVVFGDKPDLHTAAHEAAHVVQQRGGVQLKGGVGQSGDTHEQHADAVADKVVRGESAEELLDTYAGGGKPGDGKAGDGKAGGAKPGGGAKLAGVDQAEPEAAAPVAEGPVQCITRTIGSNPPQIIDINTLDDDGCRTHLSRIGRLAAGYPQAGDSEYHYDPADQAAIKVRQTALVEQRRTTLVQALVAKLAGLGTAADHQAQPPWNGRNPAGVEGPETAGANVQPVEATIVAAWTAFLGAGPYSHKHPRTGAVDATRLVSSDGQRSIRYGNHEQSSNAANHHFHQETWVYNAGTNTITVNNTMRRASVK